MGLVLMYNPSDITKEMSSLWRAMAQDKLVIAQAIARLSQQAQVDPYYSNLPFCHICVTSEGEAVELLKDR